MMESVRPPVCSQAWQRAALQQRRRRSAVRLTGSACSAELIGECPLASYSTATHQECQELVVRAHTRAAARYGARRHVFVSRLEVERKHMRMYCAFEYAIV